jgi:hypothetical protein
MGAPAISPRTRPARKPARPARKSAPRAKPATRARTSGNVAMLPVTAVGGLADSGVVVGMSRSRVWIGVLGVLLGGIVAMNVVGLSLSASSSETALKVEALQQDNGVLQGRIATRLSNERVTQAATTLGLAVPAPDAVDYLKSSSSDADQAAERLANGSIANAPPVLAPLEADVAATDPTATTTVSTDPAAVPAPVVSTDAATVIAPTTAPATIP